MDKKFKNKLIGRGSYGCIFKPNIECKNKSKKKKTKRISKIIIDEDTKSIDHEYKINKMISRIPNYKNWTVIWEDKCEPPKYEEIFDTTEIIKCLNEANRSVHDYNKYSQMLIGKYGGYPFKKYCTNLIKKSTFTNHSEFKKVFLKLFKLLNNLFIGLIELQKINIVHQDLSVNNILFKKNNLYIIDYGLSCKFNNINFIYKRSRKQITGSRIYDPYPYEYCYMYATRKERKKEINRIIRKDYRNNHIDYLFIHKKIFNRNYIHETMINNLNYNSSNRSNIIKKLDVYSLGILILNILVQISLAGNISEKQLISCFHNIDIQNHLSLLKDMTEYYSDNRIDIYTAYERYRSLI